MPPLRRPAILATAALMLTLTGAPPATAAAGGVTVVGLSVDGRTDAPLGLDNPRPTLAWQMATNRDCRAQVCPADRQTGYEIQAAPTAADLRAGRLTWQSGRVDGSRQQAVFGTDLGSRDTVAWRVRVWDAHRNPSAWSKPSTWTMGLLHPEDWGDARWIDYPDRAENQPLPLFARQFDLRGGVKDARLYLSGVGLHHATVNGAEITDEVLAPGNSNYQLSSEYRTYDITWALRKGANTVGVALGNGPAYVRRSVTNPAVGRTSPYSWWQSQLKGNSVLAADAPAGSDNVRLDTTTGYHVGGTVNVDTGGGGDRLESRVITAIGADSITFTPALTSSHATGAKVTGSGNNIAAGDPSAGAAVTPRLIGRLEITYRDGRTEAIVTDRSWRTSLGPLVTDAWYSGADYDARREQPGWDRPGARLNAPRWIAAGIAPPPNLATRLVARGAEPVKIQERLTPVSVAQPVPGTWVFDLGQNIVGWPRLNLPKLPAGVTVKMAPAESLNPDGTVNQASLMGGGGSRGTDLFNTYTTAGRERGEAWHPDFNYFGMQWVQVTGLPAGFVPGKDLIIGVRLQADVPTAGTFTSSNPRINRIHTMARYSFASNIMSVFTDCPGREKLSYPADYTMPMGAIHRDFELDAFLRTTMRHLVEGQSVADTPMAGNVALKTPVYDWGYTGRFGDEINWGNAIVLVPSMLHELYGDTALMGRYYDRMVRFVDYIQREKVVDGYFVDAALADWVAAEQTSGRITGTWGYYQTITAMARIATLTGHTADAARYTQLAADIRDAFNAAFYDPAAGRYATGGVATQTAQALALDAGLVPDAERKRVLDALVELVYAFHPNGTGPHFSGGTIGMAPTVRALMNGDRPDVLWDLLQENDEPSYGFFMASTPANPGGMTTIGERWNRGDSKNHMILAQIEEWFHAGIAGIRVLPEGRLIVQPQPVGDLRSATGTYRTTQGEARSTWTKTRRTFTLTVTVPANTRAEVRVPATDPTKVDATHRTTYSGAGDGHVRFTVPAGTHTFTVTTA